MASVYRTKDRKGKPYPAWRFRFKGADGRQVRAVGWPDRKRTLEHALACEAEARAIRKGEKPPPSGWQAARGRAFAEVVAEYLEWGKAQGGRRGFGWGAGHLRMRRDLLKWWSDRLNLRSLADLDGILPRVEKALRELQAKGRAGKTLANRAEALHAFGFWCKARGYLAADPLEGLAQFDTTPKSERRALTREEFHRLLDASTPPRRLVYATAAASGLRAGELAALRVKHLDPERGGLHLEARWTKNRRAGFQPVARALISNLSAASEGKRPDDPLLAMPRNYTEAMDGDLGRAGVPKHVPDEGKVDFHALRVFFCTLLDEEGASAKEAEELARHAPSGLTSARYQRTRPEHLRALAESVGQAVLDAPVSHASSTQRVAVAGGDSITAEHAEGSRDLRLVGSSGGGPASTGRSRPGWTPRGSTSPAAGRSPSAADQGGAVTGDA